MAGKGGKRRTSFKPGCTPGPGRPPMTEEQHQWRIDFEKSRDLAFKRWPDFIGSYDPRFAWPAISKAIDKTLPNAEAIDVNMQGGMKVVVELCVKKTTDGTEGDPP